MDTQDLGLELYLEPTYFIDWKHPAVMNLSEELTAGLEDPAEIAAKLFYYVRDAYWYSPYHVSFVHDALKASYVIEREGEKKAYCTEKAVVFAALCRANGIPNRLIFCNVRNHIATERFEEVIGTNLMVFHGYNEVLLDGKWVKCTVAFNKGLCDKLGVQTLEFDGVNDDIFQEYDKGGGQFMVYEHDYGSFHDVPHDLWVAETIKHYGDIINMETMNALQQEKTE